MFIEHFFIVFNILSSIIFYSVDEIVTMSKIPKFSNETPPPQKKNRPLLRYEVTFYAKSGLIFF